MILFVSVAVVMAIGMFGIILPWVPGLILMWLAALSYGVFGEFGTVGIVAMAIITVLVLVGEALGFVLPGRAAGKAGAPGASIAVGALGAAVGFFVIPVFGIVIGGILGVFLAEYLRTSSTEQAWQTTSSTLIGFGVGALVQLAFALAIVATWLVWAAFG